MFSFYLFIVIKDSIHVLDPDRIHGSIEDDPFPVFGRTYGKLTERVSKHTWVAI